MPSTRRASKSPAPPVRRSSRQSTPTREMASPPPSTRTTRSSAVGLPGSASTPSLSALVPPQDDSTPTSPGRGMRKSASTRALSPRVAAKVSRPPLPTHAANTLFPKEKDGKGGKAAKVHKVKTQTLHLGEEGGTIMIARVKCPVPKNVPGHLIKRFDTNAVSASSLFRAAFPFATEEEEKLEMRWIAVGSRGQYGDTVKAGMEHDESKKLSGTWIPAAHAHALATEYGIARYAVDLIDYVEDSEAADQPDTPEGSFDDSPAARSPRAKRARVSSPLAGKAGSSSAQALSGATGPGVSILQTLSTSAETGDITETTEVKVDVPAGDDVPQFDASAEHQLKEAQKLVQDLAKNHVLADLADGTHIPEPHASTSTKKRAHEVDEDDEPLPEHGTLADALGTVDNRSFFAKLFRRNPKKRRTPVQGGRETRALPASRTSTSANADVPQVVIREEDNLEEGRRWVAGLGLAVAVGATAAAPYLFG